MKKTLFVPIYLIALIEQALNTEDLSEKINLLKEVIDTSGESLLVPSFPVEHWVITKGEAMLHEQGVSTLDIDELLKHVVRCGKPLLQK